MPCTSNFFDCGSASTDLPSFCCSNGSQCIWLAANTTVLCCPDGATCNTISPVTCDENLQDAERNPEAPIKTTALDVKLGSCGNGMCCPHGYECADGKCEISSVQNVAPGEDNAGGSATTSTTTTATTATTGSPPITTYVHLHMIRDLMQHLADRPST